MLNIYIEKDGKLTLSPSVETENALAGNIVWLDLLNPSKDEENRVEQWTGLEVPTREEMQEIEFSSRFYREGNARYLTATMIANAEGANPCTDAVTFIISPLILITIRYIEPRPFHLYSGSVADIRQSDCKPVDTLIGLLEAAIDRLADILEMSGRKIDEETHALFQQPTTASLKKLNHKTLMYKIGAIGDLVAKTRESLVSFNRLMTYFAEAAHELFDEESQARISILAKDISSLSDHANFIAGKVSFLLQAIFGLINIEQNGIIKIFSVAAVIFLPPTLIASIYGMNFEYMPELHWQYGYPFAVMLMIFVAWLPYKFFKHKGWF